MADLKISQMEVATKLKSTDLIPIIQDGENKIIKGEILNGIWQRATILNGTPARRRNIL